LATRYSIASYHLLVVQVIQRFIDSSMLSNWTTTVCNTVVTAIIMFSSVYHRRRPYVIPLNSSHQNLHYLLYFPTLNSFYFPTLNYILPQPKLLTTSRASRYSYASSTSPLHTYFFSMVPSRWMGAIHIYPPRKCNAGIAISGPINYYILHLNHINYFISSKFIPINYLSFPLNLASFHPSQRYTSSHFTVFHWYIISFKFIISRPLLMFLFGFRFDPSKFLRLNLVSRVFRRVRETRKYFYSLN